MTTPEWQAKWIERPNPDYNHWQTSIVIGRYGAIYYPVEGGFKLDLYRKNAKLYTSESEIRGVILRQLLSQIRKTEMQILSALESVQ